MVNVTRPACGISLNAGFTEYLLDVDGNPMQFENQRAAENFLIGVGLDEDALSGLEFPQVSENSNQTLTDNH